VRCDAAALVDSAARTNHIEHADVHGPEATHESIEGETQSTLNVVAYFLMKVQLLNANVETHKPSRSRFAYTVTITRREIVKK
jgi:hypothetical protein